MGLLLLYKLKRSLIMTPGAGNISSIFIFESYVTSIVSPSISMLSPEGFVVESLGFVYPELGINVVFKSFSEGH